MSTQGLGLGFSVLLCGLMAGGSVACMSPAADREPNESEEGVPSAGGERRSAPTEIVQRMDPARDHASAASGPSASNAARTSPDVAPMTQKRLAEPITSKHLEAELNRLEAELGR